jgi:hypothetical protein
MIEPLTRKRLADILVRKLELRKGDCLKFYKDRETNGILIVKVSHGGG